MVCNNAQPKVPKAAFNNQRQYSVAQTKQALAQPLMWTFPEDPVQAVKPETSTFELKQPLPANTVGVRCGNNQVRVEVKRDLFAIGQLILPSDLTLGGCAAIGEDVEAQRLNFESDLQGCNSKLEMTEEFLTYSFKLIYQPSPIGSTPVIRTSQTVVDIECYYTRRNNLSSSALKPSWLSFADSKVAEENLYFSLRLMTDNWQLMRKSSHYFLGERIHVEAGVLPYLRVFVDHCVATLTPDRNTEPRYTFIENYGCLVDAVLTDSTSQFLPRSQDHMLQFYLEAFRFKPQNTSSGSNRKTGQDVDRIYITCHLKATAASSPSDAQHKACSFVDVWRAVDGDDEVCSCCDSSCTTRTARDVSIDTDVQWEADAVLGPIYIH
uniref:Zona pellucida sperm-binding protein 3 n=1 Tax=Esox lucius TaxID=8010 RepID=A0A3P8XF95_ESOLU